MTDVKGIKKLDSFDGYEYNYAYFPILIDENKYGTGREKVYDELKKHNIYSRRYFYPLISNMPTYRSLPSAEKQNLPVANKIAEQVLCLPIYGNLEFDALITICLHLKKIMDGK